MDLRDIVAFDPTLAHALNEFLDFDEDIGEGGSQKQQQHAPSRAYLRDRKAMAATPADVKELSDAYLFVVDMPGLKRDQIKVQVDEGNVLVVSGMRKREKEKDKEGGVVRYVSMERRLGKYLKKFVLPENADTEKIQAKYEDGVLTVRVEKKPPPAPKKPKTIQVEIA